MFTQLTLIEFVLSVLIKFSMLLMAYTHKFAYYKYMYFNISCVNGIAFFRRDSEMYITCIL